MLQDANRSHMYQEGISSLFLENIKLKPRRVDDFSFFDGLSPFCFLLNEFHYTFPISCKIIYYVY